MTKEWDYDKGEVRILSKSVRVFGHQFLCKNQKLLATFTFHNSRTENPH